MNILPHNNIKDFYDHEINLQVKFFNDAVECNIPERAWTHLNKIEEKIKVANEQFPQMETELIKLAVLLSELHGKMSNFQFLQEERQIDYRTVHPQFMKDFAPVGLRNRAGADCWANSLLQLLLNSPYTSQRILARRNRAVNQEIPAQISTMVQNYYKAQLEAEPIADSVDTRILRQLCPGIEKQIDIHSDPYDGFVDVLRNIGMDYIFTQKFDNGHGMVLKSETPRNEPLIQLNLMTPKSQFSDLLDNFFCDTVEYNHVDVTRHSRIEQPPQDLLIQAQRFGQNEKGFFKVTKPIEGIPNIFKLNRNYTKYNEEVNYELTGCIIHWNIEGTVNGGHYTSLIKKQDQWYHINDSVVAKISDEEASKLLKQGYIFQYQKTDASLPIALIHPAKAESLSWWLLKGTVRMTAQVANYAFNTALKSLLYLTTNSKKTA